MNVAVRSFASVISRRFYIHNNLRGRVSVTNVIRHPFVYRGASREPRVMIMNRVPPAMGDTCAPIHLFLRLCSMDFCNNFRGYRFLKQLFHCRLAILEGAGGIFQDDRKAVATLPETLIPIERVTLRPTFFSVSSKAEATFKCVPLHGTNNTAPATLV